VVLIKEDISTPMASERMALAFLDKSDMSCSFLETPAVVYGNLQLVPLGINLLLATKTSVVISDFFST
jgi:hypothetical protein